MPVLARREEKAGRQWFDQKAMSSGEVSAEDAESRDALKSAFSVLEAVAVFGGGDSETTGSSEAVVGSFFVATSTGCISVESIRGSSSAFSARDAVGVSISTYCGSGSRTSVGSTAAAAIGSSATVSLSISSSATGSGLISCLGSMVTVTVDCSSITDIEASWRLYVVLSKYILV